MHIFHFDSEVDFSAGVTEVFLGYLDAETTDIPAFKSVADKGKDFIEAGPKKAVGFLSEVHARDEKLQEHAQYGKTKALGVFTQCGLDSMSSLLKRQDSSVRVNRGRYWRIRSFPRQRLFQSAFSINCWSFERLREEACALQADLVVFSSARSRKSGSAVAEYICFRFCLPFNC